MGANCLRCSLETAAVNSPRILRGGLGRRWSRGGLAVVALQRPSGLPVTRDFRGQDRSNGRQLPPQPRTSGKRSVLPPLWRGHRGERPCHRVPLPRGCLRPNTPESSPRLHLLPRSARRTRGTIFFSFAPPPALFLGAPTSPT